MAPFYGRHPDPLASETILSVLGLSRALVDHFATGMSRHDLSMSRFAVLVRLWQTDRERAPLNEIAEWCNVSPRNITGLVDGLAAAGLVERVAQHDDRRVTLARLTPAGIRLVERVAAEHWAEQARLLAGVSETDRRTLIDLCIRLGSRITAVQQPTA